MKLKKSETSKKKVQIKDLKAKDAGSVKGGTLKNLLAGKNPGAVIVGESTDKDHKGR